MWDFSSFFMEAFSAMNLPLNTAFIVSHKFGSVVWSFSLNFRKSLISTFISSLTYWWFRWALFNFHVFVGFLELVLLLTSSFIPWWSDKVHWVIPTFFVFVEVCFVTKYVVNFWEVLWGAEKKVYSFLFGWNIL